MPLATSSLIAFVLTADPDGARTFYRDVLGLPLIEDLPFALVFDANATPLRVQKVDTVPAPIGTVVGWHVSYIAATMADLSARGVTFEQHADLTDENGLWTTPNGDKIAWFVDPDGNRLSLTEFTA